MLDLSNRKNTFYWQTDRDITPEEYDTVFLRRQTVADTQLAAIIKEGVASLAVKTLEIIPPDENVLRGSVNIVRKIVLNGEKYIVRMHPKGVKNGYFYVEREALRSASEHHLPVPRVIEVHEAVDENDMDFILMSVSSGITMDNYLKKDISKERDLLVDSGKQVAQIHSIKVEGFGSFDNQKAKTEKKLVGLKNSNTEFIHTALEENLERLVKLSICSPEEVSLLQSIMNSHSFEPKEGPVLVHNDYADWNVLTDGQKITGILDWDECIGGDPVMDLACFSLFFKPERLVPFLEGYKSHSTLPDDYEEKMHYYRLRYAISKMALRGKRSLVDDSEFLKKLIEAGKIALENEIEWFKKNS